MQLELLFFGSGVTFCEPVQLLRFIAGYAYLDLQRALDLAVLATMGFGSWFFFIVIQLAVRVLSACSLKVFALQQWLLGARGWWGDKAEWNNDISVYNCCQKSCKTN